MSHEVDPVDPVLSLHEVALRRNGKSILEGVDLVVRPGEHWALVGPNGAGKSTVLALCGAQGHPTSGTVEILGHRLGRVDVTTLRTMIGHVNPRHPIEGSPSVEEVVFTGYTGTTSLPRRFEPTAEQRERVARVIAEVGMAERTERRWATMSQGERGRVLIARALVARPQLLLLDEPTTGLDVAGREQLLTALDNVATAEPGTAIVVVTHYLEELPRTTSHAALMREGRIVACGSAEETLTSEHVSAAFDYPIEVARLRGRWHASGAASD